MNAVDGTWAIVASLCGALGFFFGALLTELAWDARLADKAKTGMRLPIGRALYWIRRSDQGGYVRADVDPPGLPCFVDPVAVLAARALQPPGIPREAVEIRKTIPVL